MRISDWSSDVGSSDLSVRVMVPDARREIFVRLVVSQLRGTERGLNPSCRALAIRVRREGTDGRLLFPRPGGDDVRSRIGLGQATPPARDRVEERMSRTGCGSKGKSRWRPFPEK